MAGALTQSSGQGGSGEKTSLGPSCMRAATSNPSKGVLLNMEGSEHGPQGWTPAPRVRPDVAQHFLASNGSSGISKKGGQPRGSVVKGMLQGRLSFIHTWHKIENRLSISKTYFY